MSSREPSDIYHERQIRELCALHALNNLFQCKNAFTKPELDLICNTLSPDNWINPHKSVLGIGNYDINVIMKALQSRGCEAVWFDKRKDPNCLNLPNIIGLIFNIPSDYKISFITIPLINRHWATIKQINGIFYNLDSKLETPQAIGTEEELMHFVRMELDDKDKEMFVVVSSEVAENKNWLKDLESYSNNDCYRIQERDAEVVQLKDILPLDPKSQS
ncbi:hypothetical protein HHI36_008273 [Cryptolaemus montrouzieri]|uniref:Josephin-2 n=1 Tax=Cryptolaemus montrouzieri TaxID=559131 RepID=A0ABD2MS23_9CUCU